MPGLVLGEVVLGIVGEQATAGREPGLRRGQFVDFRAWLAEADLVGA
jgi:hypothetical protein